MGGRQEPPNLRHSPHSIGDWEDPDLDELQNDGLELPASDEKQLN